MILFYKTWAHSSHCSFFTLSPKETGFPYEKGRIMSVGKSTSMAKMRSRHNAFLPAELLDGNLSEVRAHFRYLYPGLVEEMALKLTKERADMKLICKVPMSYGGRQCAFLLWLLNMSQLPRKMSFPLDFLSVALIGYWGVFRL